MGTLHRCIGCAPNVHRGASLGGPGNETSPEAIGTCVRHMSMFSGEGGIRTLGTCYRTRHFQCVLNSNRAETGCNLPEIGWKNHYQSPRTGIKMVPRAEAL